MTKPDDRGFAPTDWQWYTYDRLDELRERWTDADNPPGGVGPLGIEPVGALERVPSRGEARQWAPKALKDKVNDATGDALEAAVVATK